MQHRYLPMTDQDQKEMLDRIGVSSIDELFADIPESVRFKGEYNIKAAVSEPDLLAEMAAMAKKNANLKEYKSFLGAGAYDHYIPVVVDHVLSRSEFYTAYTPYQPEISQGVLQAIFEFQTMICEMTGMEVANASMYDGGTALAEAAMLSAGHTRRKQILVSRTVQPDTREILQTYARGQNLEVVEIPEQDGVTSLTQLEELMNENTACVLVQYPNFFGRIEDLAAIEKITHANKSLFVVSSNPLALGVLTPPGKFGADIVVGDAQPFGIPTSYGGPYCGFFAVTEKLMRKVPGRLVGQTVDEEGKRGFVLTLQAREQHIRRDKATSNICSNQALCALAASVSMATLGKQGVREMASQNIQKAHYARNQFKSAGFEVVYEGPGFNEFIVRLPINVDAANKRLLQKGFIGGFNLEKNYPELKNCMLVCVTEMRKKADIDTFVREMGDLHA
ncbi:MAG: glycine dehydrogenase [Bacillales bacterium]|jgi:glycine dehydrogenase subunit 1|nr:glycine dehydrogenase [Bacillales bacterium]